MYFVDFYNIVGNFSGSTKFSRIMPSATNRSGEPRGLRALNWGNVAGKTCCVFSADVGLGLDSTPVAFTGGNILSRWEQGVNY